MSASRKLASLVALAAPVAADTGDDFSNNMFSDLAPLLALFGERVTMQFMSQSMGWADNIVLGMAPLGIITTIVSAIRVGGPSWLKALVGRARENLAVAEVELMSSTSHEVCELWNGQQVVRCMGTAPIMEFICLLPTTMPDKGAKTQPKIRIIDLKEARDDHFLEKIDLNMRDDFGRWRISHNSLGRTNKDQEKEPDLPTEVVIIGKKLDKTLPAPNISLNCHSYFWRGELRAVAVLGTILQLGVLVYSGFATYHLALRFQKDDRPIARYAYPCTAIGTLVMVAGVVLCAHVVESSTTEKRYQAKKGKKARLVWLQQAKTVNDQTFDSFAIFTEDDRSVITTSHRAADSLHDETDEDAASQSSDAQHSKDPIERPSSRNGQALSWSSQSDTPRTTTPGVLLRRVWRRARARNVTAAPTAGRNIPADTAPSDVTSRSNKPNNETSSHMETRRKMRSVDALLVSKTIAGTVVCLGGFIVQFIGLRGMHWSASVAQLGAVIVMTALRAWVRRGLAKPPQCLGLLPGFELEWFATTLGDVGSAPWLAPDSEEGASKPASFKEEATDYMADGKGDIKDWRIVTGGGPETHQRFGGTRQSGNPEATHDDDSKAHTVMALRRKLGRLAHWRGPASAEAIALTRAIEITMNTLFLHDSEHEESPVELTWTLGAHYAGPGAQPVHFRLVKRDGQWKVLSDEIDAALSLWLYSANRMEQASSQQPRLPQHRKQARTTGETKRPADEDEWFREEESREKRSLRLLGPSSHALHRDIQWWIPHGIARVIEVKEDRDGELEVQNYRIVGCGLDSITSIEHDEDGESKEPDENKGRELEVRNCRTAIPCNQCQDFDCRARYGIRELPTKFDPYDIELTADYDPDDEVSTTGSGPDNIELPTGFDPDDRKASDGETASTSLATESHDALQLLYAQDMLSAFVWSMTKTMAPVEDDAELRPSSTDESDGWKFFTLWNERLSKMIHDIHNTGLGTLDQIYLSIIPPLSVHQKLPRAGIIVDIAQKQARQHEQFQRWDEAGEVYSWLFRTARTYPEGSDIATSGIAVLMEYLRTVTLGLELGEEAQQAEEDLKLLRMLKPRLEDELRTADGQTLLHLMRLYETQGRGWKCVPVQEAQETRETMGNFVPGIWTTNDYYPESFKVDSLHMVALVGHDSRRISTEISNGSNVNARDIHNWTPLHYSAVKGGEFGIDQLFRYRGDVNARDIAEWTPLHYACIRGDISIVQALVRKGAEVDARGRDGLTPLHNAARSGHGDVVRCLIEAGASADALDESGYTPLLWAAFSGHEDVVDELWSDANKRLRSHNGRTVLHLAVIAGSEAVVRLLVGRDIDMDAKDRLGLTSLHYAARNNSEGVARLLVEGDADKDARDNDGRTPLHYTAREGHRDIARLLISGGANKEATDKQGLTPLHLAAIAGHGDFARLLIVEYGADTGAKSTSEQTPLHYAAAVGHEDVARILLVDGGAEKSARDVDWCTPLHHAADNEHEGVAKLLIMESSADIGARDIRKETPLHRAVLSRHEGAVAALIGSKDRSGETPLHFVANRGLEGLARVLVIEGGADTNTKNVLGRTPLHKAASCGHSDVARLLILEGGADTNVKDVEEKTPLHYAVRGRDSYDSSDVLENDDVVRLLIVEGGADLGAKDFQGKTPLHYASEGRHESTGRILIEAGADTGATDEEGQTPLHYAATSQFGEAIARTLIEAGADPGAKDSEGETPLHYAARSQFGEAIAKILIMAGADPNAEDDKGRTPPHYVARSRPRGAMAKILIEAGAKGAEPIWTGRKAETFYFRPRLWDTIFAKRGLRRLGR